MQPTDPRHRQVRSFVLREGRLTPGQERAFAELWPRFGVDWQAPAPLDLGALFGNDQPVTLEIGFGNGESLARMAADDPGRNWLGVEVHRPGVGHLLLEIERLGIDNLRVMRQDAVELLTHGIAPGALDRVQLFFPDPWPKKRHHKRRILNPGMIALLERAIRPGGHFHAATDWEPYAEQMLETLEAATGFANTAGAGHYTPRPESRPLTKFEQRGERLGHVVHDLVFRRG
ncbi:tRNA (guanosine(46)-N7)-methyltransferase TrmB [Marichromatium gracile]|uniref:tRNA (guanine-N(7)-)-methyltransferase n=1 Tax=Marichromatium gracile TaxID=1048 RepID=A0A4V2WAN6_MARGR|nr:tRNA (guanosine(46)-N7)-methyltransferase TrmB [Marichromatium gracile]MBK1707487.1 tRNA (guanosine(46)-N7)-methyltransferase TrmB [Marichromatium gracile]MCF1184269.1 tRNA (guanosine(46)-N7)-methyltransferase TrmB [Marichromatium gracile]TCW39840.1 tRNA (guanine-N(7)-)-methyltransferase [Marichromatium gracile]